MTLADIVFLPETPAHEPQIEAINEEAFGPGRFARAAYKIREGGPHDRRLSFVALSDGKVVGSARMTPVAAGLGRALLLGPLAVRPAFMSMGIGRKLVELAIRAAVRAEAPAVVLVGDEPYYGPLGFRRISKGQLWMPRPVDPDRLLGLEIAPGSLAALRGELRHVERTRGPPAKPSDSTAAAEELR